MTVTKEEPKIIQNEYSNIVGDIADGFSSKGRVNIIKILIEVGETNISRIATASSQNHGVCSGHLKALTTMGILQEKVFGRIKIYRLRIEEPKVRALKNIFELWRNY
jgi:predicted transcriptional regulator